MTKLMLTLSLARLANRADSSLDVTTVTTAMIAAMLSRCVRPACSDTSAPRCANSLSSHLSTCARSLGWTLSPKRM